MTTPEELEGIGLNAVDYFLETWNSRNPENWADSLNFPHVRPSPTGPVRVSKTAKEYISGVDFQKAIDSGWDHSEWDYRSVLHVSPSKIHVAGQWSRYNNKSEVILTTPIVYIVTKDVSHWGIQSRFGADYTDETADNTELESRGVALIQDFVNQHNAGNQLACAKMLNYPHFKIGIGELTVTKTSGEFQINEMATSIASLQVIQSGKQSLNVMIDLNDLKNDQVLQGVLHINNRNNHLGIQAWSFI